MSPPFDSPNSDNAMPPALVVRGGESALAEITGEIDTIDRERAAALVERGEVLLVHPNFVARRLGLNRPARRDTLFNVLELFAFAFPARACVPTPAGVIRAMGLDTPESIEEEAALLHLAVARMLEALSGGNIPYPEQAATMAGTLHRAGWSWGPLVAAALAGKDKGPLGQGSGLEAWSLMPEWEERAPEPPHGTEPVFEAEAKARLQELVGQGGEARPAQATYAGVAAAALAPREPTEPHVTIAEAGTGLGKTLGYLAPISVWSEKNGPGTWVATYTKNLQRQLDQELTRLYPDPEDKRRWTAIRKGRENYLCLLNFQEIATRALSGLGGAGQVEVGLIARWALASRDGDMVGGDFPAWLETGFESQLTDRRGECIYSACPHYKKCVIERSVRKARRARIVVANHALVLHQAAVDMALTTPKDEPQEDAPEQRRYLFFDEGHHLFNAADSAFSAHLTALETSELRRWIRGPEGRRGSRARGLVDRVGELTAGANELEATLQKSVRAARCLPGEGWSTRVTDGTPQGPVEELLTFIRTQIIARHQQSGPGAYQNWETDVFPLVDGLEAASLEAEAALKALATPLMDLAKGLRERLDEEAEDLETSTRIRIEAAARGLERRAGLMLPAWINMAASMRGVPQDDFVNWFSMENFRGRLYDVGMHSHWVDPTKPLAQVVLERAQGVFITSATLRDQTTEEESDWETADVRTGVNHLVGSANRAHFASPFDYAANTKVLIVNDLSRENADQVSAAFRELFKAAGGGALGLFTAINRLRGVHERIAEPLEAEGLPLYAQHVDALDTGTLVDIFREEENACLLGTDAVRDGIDVPGNSLRLIVFDRVPWPRPDILHRARREAFGKRTYDDLLTRLRLKQAYGRLVRRESDRGVFVMLDGRTPSRLLTAFPEGVEVSRLGLAEAIAETRDFLG